jgi:hypothetical protein
MNGIKRTSARKTPPLASPQLLDIEIFDAVFE